MIHFECAAGVAGDMIVGALVDAGADFDFIKKKLKPLAEVRITAKTSGDVSSTKFLVSFQPRSRRYIDLIGYVKKLRLEKKTEKTALNILRVLAQAESFAHKCPLKKVHLHEAVDIVVDATATALALESLGENAGKVTSSIISVGNPAPATEFIIKKHSLPIRYVGDEEITTPTGAAIMAVIVDEFRECYVEGEVGYGRGDKKFKYPNVVKATVGDELAMLEANLDDCTPEVMAYAAQRIREEGALEVHLLPAVMKKGRPGYLLRVLTQNPEKHAEIMMEETGTLGVRILPVIKRLKQERSIEELEFELGGEKERVGVKKSPKKRKSEFDDVSRLAKKHKIPARKIAKLASKTK